MFLLIKIIAILILAEGIIFLIKPELMKKLISFWNNKQRLYVGGFISLVFGVILLKISSSCRVPGVIMAMGVIALIKAFLILTAPARMRARVDWLKSRPNKTVRGFSFIVIAAGLLILYSL
ncbi:MAG: DUF2065 family protein [Candidatus Omnitrophica bacterium]|nr:DUF2065 family protein [Candidatus Omnitrophota bacterium]